jgi:hypothetical protein
MSIADLPGLVDVFAGHADVIQTNLFRTEKVALAIVANFASILRRFICIGEAAFGSALDCQRIGLSAALELRDDKYAEIDLPIRRIAPIAKRSRKTSCRHPRLRA